MAYVVFSTFPSFSFLGLFLSAFISNLRINKTEKQFQNIVQEEEEEEEIISIAIFGDKAYWVENNMFYEADVVDDKINKETSRPVNVFEMSLYDINKMLFILDNLVEG